VAGQSGGNNKSLLAINLNLVVIKDNQFNTWVGHKLDIALGPGKASATAALAPALNALPDYMQLSRLLASAVGQGMMQLKDSKSVPIWYHVPIWYNYKFDANIVGRF
jgi:hypothetical protein